MKGLKEPYLKLIGLGELEQTLPAREFLIASVLTEALDQRIDNTEGEELDGWHKEYVEVKFLTVERFKTGLEKLMTLQSVPKDIIALAEVLITMLESIKT